MNIESNKEQNNLTGSPKSKVIITTIIIIVVLVIFIALISKGNKNTTSDNINIPPLTAKQKTEIEKRMQEAKKNILPLTKTQKTEIEKRMQEFNANNQR